MHIAAARPGGRDPWGGRRRGADWIKKVLESQCGQVVAEAKDVSTGIVRALSSAPRGALAVSVLCVHEREVVKRAVKELSSRRLAKSSRLLTAIHLTALETTPSGQDNADNDPGADSLAFPPRATALWWASIEQRPNAVVTRGGVMRHDGALSRPLRPLLTSASLLSPFYGSGPQKGHSRHGVWRETVQSA